MRSCSVTKKLEVVVGSRGDYDCLSRFHYRREKLGAFVVIFALKPKVAVRFLGTTIVGVIVYTMPSPGLALRNKATGHLFSGFDRATRLSLINANIRCIARVIIEPRFRGLGLAARLVRETMAKLNMPIVEALAVMGHVNPFFEKAGMTVYTAPPTTRVVQMTEAFSLAGIEASQLIDVKRVHRKLLRLSQAKTKFIESQIRKFMQSYGKQRHMPPSLERTRFVLSKLTARPAYYIWFNPERKLQSYE